MKKYSIIKPDPTLQNNLMAYGFMCGLGWYPLIRETLDKIQAIVDRDGFDLEITEVKEKFGELRIYTSIYIEEIEDIIEEATNKSTKICELCGKPGKLHNVNGWWSTLCEECLEGKQR
jgi:hypothetical protein